MNDALKTQVGGDHYKSLAIQPTEFCQKNKLGFCEANVVKYVTRHKSKGKRKDIEKAIHYLEILLALEYPDDEVTAEVKEATGYKPVTFDTPFTDYLKNSKLPHLAEIRESLNSPPKEWDGEFGSVKEIND